MQPFLSVKRGDTFFFNLEIKLADNVTPLVVSVDKLKCQIRKINTELVDTLEVSTTATEGTYLFTASDDKTLDYPIGELELDVKLNDGGIVVSTPTIKVLVDKDVTKWV